MADVWKPPSSQKPESSTLGICDATKEWNTLLYMYRPSKLNVLEHFHIWLFLWRGMIQNFISVVLEYPL
jgi:hypothetical protein